VNFLVGLGIGLVVAGVLTALAFILLLSPKGKHGPRKGQDPAESPQEREDRIRYRKALSANNDPGERPADQTMTTPGPTWHTSIPVARDGKIVVEEVPYNPPDHRNIWLDHEQAERVLGEGNVVECLHGGERVWHHRKYHMFGVPMVASNQVPEGHPTWVGDQVPAITDRDQVPTNGKVKPWHTADGNAVQEEALERHLFDPQADRHDLAYEHDGLYQHQHSVILPRPPTIHPNAWLVECPLCGGVLGGPTGSGGSHVVRGLLESGKTPGLAVTCDGVDVTIEFDAPYFNGVPARVKVG
jgi:hypothetical protein